MKINKIDSQLTFGTKVDSKFIESAERFYVSRNLPIQMDKFKKTVQKLDLYGNNTSTVFHNRMIDNGKFINALFLKNPEINKTQAVVIAKAERFSDMLRFFTGLDDSKIEKYEEILGSAD